jgi:hypothetical protein
MWLLLVNWLGTNGRSRQQKIALRKLLLGQILQPNYQLVIKHKGQILIKQKGNSLWPRLYLKEIKEETKDFVK